MPNNKKGFTLIELLVVMGILGILMAVTILVINPAQYLARARDTQRINDIGAVNSAIGTYLANGGTLTTMGTAANVTSASLGTVATPATTVVNTVRTGASGWVPIDLSASGLATLPMDPIYTTTGYGYLYYNNGADYEIDANAMESDYYKWSSTTNNVGKNDGGNNNTCAAATAGTCRYEVGSNLTILN